jgi:hypothetical protein
MYDVTKIEDKGWTKLKVFVECQGCNAHGPEFGYLTVRPFIEESFRKDLAQQAKKGWEAA